MKNLKVANMVYLSSFTFCIVIEKLLEIKTNTPLVYVM